jgi:putative membrane protein
MAADRTWMAHERTLMAWVRTSTSMISFAFTIYKFFQFEGGSGAPITRGFFTPRLFAISLVAIAMTTLTLAVISHRREARTLTSYAGPRRSMAEVVACLMSVFGLIVLLSAVFHA